MYKSPLPPLDERVSKKLFPPLKKGGWEDLHLTCITRNHTHYPILFIFILLLTTAPCFSLPTDKMQPMRLSANSADLNEQAHRGIYIGDVQLDQGTTHVRAAKAVTEGNLKNQLVKAVIKGNKEARAHYWTLTEADKPPLHAYADTIYYYPERHSIELIGNALIEQGNDSFSAPKICYDTLHQHVISSGDGKARTTIIIHPGNNP